jgi:hypothetical protein
MIAALEEFLDIGNELRALHQAESSRYLDEAFLWNRWLRTIFFSGVRIFGNILRAIQDAQRERARSGFNRQSTCSTVIKALHKPLQVIPQSIHPIDLAA